MEGFVNRLKDDIQTSGMGRMRRKWRRPRLGYFRNAVVNYWRGLFPETKTKVAHNGRISLYATLGIGQKQFSLNAPASRLKKSCRGAKSKCLSLSLIPLSQNGLHSTNKSPLQKIMSPRAGKLWS